MKAILVIDDMPSCCTACPFFDFINDYEGDCRTICNVKFGRINEYGTEVRPSWCPLRPMPKEEDIYEVGMDEEDTNAKRQWNKGWDACIDEILGETEW